MPPMSLSLNLAPSRTVTTSRILAPAFPKIFIESFIFFYIFGAHGLQYLEKACVSAVGCPS
jgi:hypothetical protein